MMDKREEEGRKQLRERGMEEGRKTWRRKGRKTRCGGRKKWMDNRRGEVSEDGRAVKRK